MNELARVPFTSNPTTMHARMVWRLLLAVMLLVSIGACRRDPPRPVEAIGRLLAVLPQAEVTREVEVPDATITLFDKDDAQVAQVTTDLDGHFRVTVPVQGTYKVCWNIQGASNCQREVSLNDPENYLGLIRARLKGPVLYGRVLTADGRPCWVRDPFFKLDVATKVDVANAQGNAAAPVVRASTQGDYLFLLKQSGVYQVRAQCEASEQKTQATLVGALGEANLTLPNHAPRLEELAARSAGNGVVRVIPGEVVQLAAAVKDRDKDTLEYLWRDADGNVPAAVTANQFVRAAPGNAGLQTTYLLVRDGRGGYAYRRFDLEVGDAQVQFSGKVIDEVSRSPVDKATVSLGGTQVQTNAQGWFSLAVPATADNRYVVNVTHRNYALYSRVFDRSFRDNVIELIRADVKNVPVPVNGTFTITDERSSGPCGGRQDGAAKRIQAVEYIDYDAAPDHKPLDADLLRRLTAPRRDCRHRGAQIVLPALAFEDADGNVVQGTVRAAMATLDPTRRALPGDARAIDSNGSEAELLSYGAAYAEFRDNSDRLVKLRAGMTAEVRVPVPPQQQSTAQPQIDFWSYDETSGKWKYEGKAQLMNTPDGPVYAGKTTHFSYLNMDVSGNDPATATCLRFELDPALNSWTNKQMRATVSYNGNQVITKETALNNDQYHAIFRIPYGASFPPNTLRLEVSGEFNGQSVVLVDNVINTDARPKMTGNNLWPGYPYNECGTPVVLAPATGVVPQYASNDATNRPYFLTGPYGTFLPDDGETIATNYYNTIGATANKPTLKQWWLDNTFNADGSGGTRAAYLNHNDLGFGRDMHCKKNGNNVACYVTNYGAPNQLAANADAALDQDAAQRGATVAMEFRAADGAEAVQFYVYTNKGGDAGDPFGSAGLLKFADLDGFGPKPVPHLCLVCHGGSPAAITAASGNAKAQHSRFREFDLPSFRYPANAAWNYGQPVPPQINMADFGALNQMVRDTTPSTAPIDKLISGWYPVNFAQAPQQNTPPSGWNGNATDIDGYHSVYGQSCRTCHVARDGGAAVAPFIVFDTKADLAGTSYVVCGKNNRVMPNAIITYKNFWADTLRVNKYEALTGVAANTCKND